MKTTISALAIILTSLSSAFAASGAENDTNGILVYTFIGFGALILVFQFVPGIMLFFSMIKGLFTKEPRQATAANEKGTRE